ncbi:hypothetical protein [Methanobacterium sp. ACI-7]|uniref:hypothetical protein n=1 Tax=unclassified Methanobacterium TaxID=2627676 RepID=UPI0039C031A5
MKILKEINQIFMVLAARKMCSAAIETRIMGLKDVYAKKGDIKTIAVQGQFKNALEWINMDYDHLKFTISDENNQVFFSEKNKINFWDGTARTNLNTENLSPGVYKIDILFKGNNALRYSKASSNLIIGEP